MVLNGYIVDVWQFSQKHFSPEHMPVVRELIDVVFSLAELRSYRSCSKRYWPR